MGYSTDFYGQFDLDKPLTAEHAAYLRKFNETRRMGRDVSKTERRPDPIRLAVGLPLGIEGEFFVGAGGLDDFDAADVIDGNRPPATQPGLWCQWVPAEDGLSIEWDGGEKFYEYVDWIIYLIDKFLKPWGYTVNGNVEWKGEEADDLGIIEVADNRVTAKNGRVVYD